MLKTAQKCSRTFKLVGLHKKYSQVCQKPQHLICFKNWDKEMIMNVLNSAIALKMKYPCTRLKHLKLLKNHKVLIISEINEPILTAAVTQAALFLSADIFSVENKFLWDHDYNGRIFSFMADAIFASTTTHACVERMANMSLVPVMCLKSRTNATLQALAIMMTIIEEYGKIECQNIAYIGPPQPILNSLMLLSALLGANIRLKCCSKKIPNSPLLLKISRDIVYETGTLIETFTSVTKTLQYSNIIIAGPTARKEEARIFHFDMKDIADSTRYKWIFIHCCPRGKEVNDLLFYGRNSRTFNVFYNLQYIAAALMAFTVKRHFFSTSHDC